MHILYTSKEDNKLWLAQLMIGTFFFQFLGKGEYISGFSGMHSLSQAKVLLERETKTSHMIWVIQGENLGSDTTEGALIQDLPRGRYGRILQGIYTEANEGPVEAIVKQFIHSHELRASDYKPGCQIFDTAPYSINPERIGILLRQKETFMFWARDVDADIAALATYPTGSGQLLDLHTDRLLSLIQIED